MPSVGLLRGALVVALSVASASSVRATSLAERFEPRHYVSAGRSVPVDARHDAIAFVVERALDDVAVARLFGDAALRALAVRRLTSVSLSSETRVVVAWLDVETVSRAALVDRARALASMSGVRAVFPVLTRPVENGDGGIAIGADELVVTARPGTLDDVLARLSARDLTLLRRSSIPHTALVRVGARHAHDAVSASASLAERPDADIVSAEPNLWSPTTAYATVDDPLHDGQWHLHRTGAAANVPGAGTIGVHGAWEITKGDPSVVIAVVDTGIDIDHEDLAPNVVGGFDALSGDDDPRPGCRAIADGAGAVASCPPESPYRESHGTSVAGIACARGDNQMGLAGVCPSCSLLAVRFLGEGSSQVNKAEMWTRAVDDGAWIVNNSWGPAVTSFLPIAQIEEDALLYARTSGRGGLGTVMVFAAGNEAHDVHRNPYASHPTAIAVSASTNLDDWTSYSNFGEEIDVSAPSRGVDVPQDDHGIATTDVSGPEGHTADGYFDGFSGTSASAPIVAGLAGLILSANPALTAEQVRLVLTASATPIVATQVDWQTVLGRDVATELAYDALGHSIGFGFGRVDATSAVLLAQRFRRQAGPCTDVCASCAEDGSCEMACETQSHCVPGTTCTDGACRSPWPQPLDVGQPCIAACPYCTPAVTSRFLVDDVCTSTCVDDADCPGGFDCRVIESDGTSVCAVGERKMGERNFYRVCRDGEVTFDDALRGYCTESCFGSETGDCPYGFHCAPVTCECGVVSPVGCRQLHCTESVFGDHTSDLCVPNEGHGVTCSLDVDCGPGFYCGPGGLCRVDDRAGCTVCQGCASDADCGPSELCLTEGENAFCTRGCESDSDCPGNSVCKNYRTENGFTLPTCRGPDDTVNATTCDPSFTCTVGCREDLPCDDGAVCVDGVCTVEIVDAGVEDPVDAGPPAPMIACGCASGSDAGAVGVFALALLMVRRRRR